MTILLLKGFNNYYNRIRKGYPAEGYKAAVGSGNWWEYFDINFYQNDGVETTQTINFTATDPAPDGVPDYLVAFYPDSTSENPHVHSRWFVLECKHNRKNQFVLTLRRDLFIDFAAEIDDADAYIEKAAVNLPNVFPGTTTPDPALFNEEDFSANQIPTGVKWLKEDPDDDLVIVLYIAADGNEYAVKGKWDNPDTGVEEEFNRIVFPADREPSGETPYTIYFIPLAGATAQGRKDAFTAASQITSALAGAGALYDAQLVPYIPHDRNRNININVGNNPIATKYVTLHTASDDKKGFPVDITWSELHASAPETRVDFKVSNQCDKLVFYAPGMSSSFEMTPAKAGWCRATFRVQVYVTFKPINFHIQIRPVSNLYLYSGGDFYAQFGTSGDPRGLIVQKDYSLALVTNQWQTYELNNKNYMNAFNRETESIELHNKWGLATDIASAVGGTVSGAVSGGSIGGAAGAIAGGVGSAITGTIGVVGNQVMREDALDLRKDQFNYSLANVRAQPTLLNRTAANVANGQYTPYVILYTCTNTEKTALRNKIKYNGMKIMRIGKIGTYRSNLGSDCKYMKCKLIYINIKDDYHVVSEIGKELDKGFYIP